MEKKCIYMADLLPSTAHIGLPYVMGYDMRPLLTMQEKEVILKLALANNAFLFFEHDNQTECCSIIQTEKGIMADKKLRLTEALQH